MCDQSQDIIDEHHIRNYDGVLAVIDENMKLDWKSYHEKLLNTMFAWDESSFSHSDTVGNIARLIDIDMARKMISKIDSRKFVELSVIALELVKTAGKAEVDMYCGLTGNFPMLSIYTFYCPSVFLGVPKDWSRSFTGFLI